MTWRSVVRSLAFAAIGFLLGCAELQPLNLPAEGALEPTASGPLSAVDSVTRRDWQRPLNTGPDALEWRLRAIDSTVGSLDLQTFLWYDDPVGNIIRDRILAAADRGVKVRILVDDSLMAGADVQNLQFAAHPNIEYRVYNPYTRRSSGTLSRTLLNLGEFSRLDHRMHNKVMIADGHVAIIGGRNLADEYFGFDPEFNFRDMELLVGGPVITELEASFDTFWNNRWSFPIETLLRPVALGASDISQSVDASRLNSSFPAQSPQTQRAEWQAVAQNSVKGRIRLLVDDAPPERPDATSSEPLQVAIALEKLIAQAKIEIVAVTAYLIPTPALTTALRQAEERGVKVRLLTNSINSNNHLPAYAIYENHVAELLDFGVELHEVRVDAESRSTYMSAPSGGKDLGLHAKYLVIDGKTVFVGSPNLDPRSLRINTEMGIVMNNRRLAQEILALTEPDFAITNAWRVEQDQGQVVWVSSTERRNTSPARTDFQRIEAWFIAHLPIEGEL